MGKLFNVTIYMTDGKIFETIVKGTWLFTNTEEAISYHITREINNEHRKRGDFVDIGGHCVKRKEVKRVAVMERIG
jgi:hypothetical protein